MSKRTAVETVPTIPDPPYGTPLEQRIGAVLPALTTSERRLATVVLELRDRLSSYTASELAALATVSNATAARFFQRLGYESYNRMRREMRDRRFEGSPLEVLKSTEHRSAGDFRQHAAVDAQNLQRTAEAMKADEVKRAADLIRRARIVWVVGFRNSSALAIYARAVLITAKPDVRLLPAGGMTIAEDLASLQPRDTVLAIGFRRCPALLDDVLLLAQKVQVPTVLLTDYAAGPMTEVASVVLRCETAGPGPYDSYAAAISLINYLCGVEQSRTPAAVERLKEIESLHELLGSFASPPRKR